MATKTSLAATGLIQPRRFTVDDYHAMIDAGILGEDDRVELVLGEIVQMAAFKAPHPACVDALTMFFAPALSGRAIVRVQGSFTLRPDSEPEPDVLILRPRDDLYFSALPGPDDTLLAIEVADTSLRYDRVVKIPLYGRRGVPESWLVALNPRTVTVYRDPCPEGYRQMQTLRPGDILTPLAFPDLALPVTRLFPGQSLS